MATTDKPTEQAQEAKSEKNITARDVVFECPSCSKSLAIDRRGAGLTIACPDCGEPVRVPMPPEELVSHVNDLSEEFGDATALQSDLVKTQQKIEDLGQNLDKIATEQSKLDEQREAHKKMLSKLRHEFSAIQSALDNIYEHLRDADG